MNRTQFRASHDRLTRATAATLAFLLLDNRDLETTAILALLLNAMTRASDNGGRYQLARLARRPRAFTSPETVIADLGAQATLAVDRLSLTRLAGTAPSPASHAGLIADYNLRFGAQTGINHVALEVRSGRIPVGKDVPDMEAVWERIFTRSERRAGHDKLNGTSPDSSGHFTLKIPEGTFLVQHPFDPAAPWSTWVRCGHAVSWRRK